MILISTSIRYGEADMATSELFRVGFYSAREWIRIRNASLTDGSALQKDFSAFPESSKSPNLLQPALTRAPRGSRCNPQQLWLFRLQVNSNWFCGLHGLPSQPSEPKRSWNTVSFPRGLLVSGFLHQALSSHKPRTDLVQKESSKSCCVTASYKENIRAARRNLWFCHKEQGLPVSLSVRKRGKVSVSRWTILCRNWGEKDGYVLTYPLQNLNWAWISSKPRTFPSS